jgi:predicted Zn finger-like uncharacterized protein
MLRIECPECGTSYKAERLGIALMPEQSMVVTVKCLTCGLAFDTRIEPNYVTTEAGWFARYIMRREPSSSLQGHVVTSSKVRT